MNLNAAQKRRDSAAVRISTTKPSTVRTRMPEFYSTRRKHPTRNSIETHFLTRRVLLRPVERRRIESMQLKRLVKEL